MLKNMLIPLCFLLALPIPIKSETMTLTTDATINYNFTKEYKLNYLNDVFLIGNIKIKPSISVLNKEYNLSLINKKIIIKDNGYQYEFGFNITNIAIDNIDYVSFDLSGLKKLDEVSYTDGKIRIIFDDLIDKGSLQLLNDKVILYKPTSLSIDPIIELLGNSTHKFYVSGQTATERTPSYATTEFSQTDYNKTNISENIRYNTNVAPVINGLPKWRYNRFAFNLSTIPSIETIKYCIEGYYTNLDATGGQVTYYYNVTSAIWILDIPTSLDLDIESTKCKTFNSITDIYNVTSGLFQFGSDVSAEYELPTNIYIDKINVTVNYTEPPPTANITKCEYLCNSDSLDYNIFIRNNDVLINQNNQVNLINLDNEDLTNLDTNCLIFGDYRNNLCVNLNSNKAVYFKVIE